MLKKKISSIIEPVQRTCKCGKKHTLSPKTKYIICVCGEKIYEESGLEEKDSRPEQADIK